MNNYSPVPYNYIILDAPYPATKVLVNSNLSNTTNHMINLTNQVECCKLNNSHLPCVA